MRRQRLSDWVEQRSGYRGWLEGLRLADVRGGSQWGHTFGVVLTLLFVLEAVTGIGLSAYYAPTSTDAWASVSYLQNQVALGWLLRGLHHHAAHAMVLVAAAHLFQTLAAGAYRAPRDLNWMIGALTLLLLLITAHLGFLLPGDLRGYWAGQVLLGITGNQPLVGPWAQRLVQGGPSYGNVTLTHFYALHALVLPVALAALTWVHVALRRRVGAMPPRRLRVHEVDARTERYFPFQAVKDLTATLAVMGVLVAVTLAQHGAELHAPADPSAEFLARPEWYFLPLFGLRQLFPGSLEFIATAVLPGLALLFLLSLPFLHEWLRQRTPHAHRLLLGAVTAGTALALLLGLTIEIPDRTQPERRRMVEKSRAQAAQAQTLAKLGVPVEGPLFLYRNDPRVFGERVFVERCANCHSPCDVQPYRGDLCLEGYASRAWLKKLLRDPSQPHFFGNTGIDEMEPFAGDDEQLRALVEFVYSQGERADVNPPLVARGEKLYTREGCASCHSLDGKGTGDAPDLKGYASVKWLNAFIRDPGAPVFYGASNKMDAFPHDKLGADELSAVVSYLRAQADADTKYP